MSIKLNIDSQFFSREKDPSKDIRMEVADGTVEECLGQYLATKPHFEKEFFDKTGQLEKSTYVYINRVPIFTDKLEHRLKDGDELMFIYASQEP